MSVDREPDFFRVPELECLGYFVGRDVYMELKGGDPTIPDRREIALKGKVVDVKEFNVEQRTITVEIPIANVASLSESPITVEQHREAGVDT